MSTFLVCSFLIAIAVVPIISVLSVLVLSIVEAKRNDH